MSKTVLIVDASTTTRKQVSEALELAGFSTLEASDGLQSLSLLDSCQAIDLIISELNMPDLTAFELVKKIRDRLPQQHLPIMMLTSESQPELVKKAREIGAAAWIVRPYNPQHLIATARHLTHLS